MNIPVIQGRPLFTQRVADVYREVTRPTRFYKSFFRDDFGTERFVKVEVERNDEAIAVDVFRGASDGNRNTFSLSSEKTWEPPFYDEFFDLTELAKYDRLFGRGDNISLDDMAEMVKEVRDHLMKLENKIVRSYELQAVQVIFDGIVQLKAATNIDFRRKAASLVAYSAGIDFSDDTIDPTILLEQGCNFIRSEGKSAAAEYNLIMDGSVYRALKNNAIFKENADVRRYNLVDINLPQRNAEGAVYQGQLSTGSYLLNMWTYEQFYKDPTTGLQTPYTPANKLAIVPTAPRFTHGFAGVPYIMRDEANAEFSEFIGMRSGAFHIDNIIDKENYSHKFRVRSAGICIPVAVDTIFTAQVLN